MKSDVPQSLEAKTGGIRRTVSYVYTEVHSQEINCPICGVSTQLEREESVLKADLILFFRLGLDPVVEC